jgi:Fic family protein
MFDPQKPYNDLPLLPIGETFENLNIYKVLNFANLNLGRVASASLLLPSKELLFSPLTVKEAVESNEIESIRTTVEEAFQAELFPEKTGHSKEALKYRDALLHGYELIKKFEFLSINHIIEIQSILEPNKQGIRHIPGTKIINGYGPLAEIIYTPPEGYNVLMKKLSNFEKYFNEKIVGLDDLDPLIRVAILHYQFEAIHPFLDGNGRTGRILIILYLILHQRIHIPVLYLSSYILSNKSRYYALLNNITKNNEWGEWVEFILWGIADQSNKTELTIWEIKKLEGEIKSNIKMNYKNIYSTDIMDFLFSKPFYTIDSLSKWLNVHRTTATNYLNTLYDGGLIKKNKLGKTYYYYNQQFLDLLS